MTEEPHSILQINGLTKKFGMKRALNLVDLSVFEGDFITLFGPNGAGKTTFLKTISTIVKPTSGKIFFKGERVTEESIYLREQIGLVSHNSLLYEDLTARENLYFFSRIYGIVDKDKRIDELLKKVGLYHRQHDLVRTFSRGMIQRLSIARAVIHDPPILLLDEPYTGLDIQAIQILDELMEELKSTHRTFIMTSHDINKGFEHANRVAILSEGRLVYHSKKKDIGLNEFTELFWKWVKKDRVS